MEKASPNDADGKFSPGDRYILGVLCTTMLFEGMNLANANVQLPQITADLRLGADATQLVTSSYLVVFGGLLLLGGRLADTVGRRRAFLVAVGIFGLGSLLATTAASPVMLISGRVVQGIGAAFTVPGAMAIIATTFPEGPARSRALGIWAAVGGSGYAAGLLVTGGLTQLFGWRSGFGIFVVMALLILCTGYSVLPDDKDNATGLRLRSLARPLTSTVALLMAVYGIGSITAHPEAAAACLVTALALTICLVIIARARGTRQLPRALVGSRCVQAANLVAFTFFAGVSAAIFVVSLYLQRIEHYGPFAAGVVFLPTAVLSVIASPRGARLVNRLGARTGLTLGSALVAIATAAHALSGLVGPVLAVIIPASLVMTLGIALAYPGAMIAAMSGASETMHGVASALVITMQQVGGAVGVALATVATSAVNGGTLANGTEDAPGLRVGLLACAGLAGLGLAAWVLLHGPRASVGQCRGTPKEPVAQ
ncbi:MFS transporter [Actinomadura madurae]|uniref:MFS transporter n=1 Tax=Actinomadura madurae TaxID=1993 RepID=UPI0020D23E50|nr:MFS transporter [Actinomadura madurae]MCP9955730.1 MFS transporter [Actinomadura madurae]MCP9972461.1 MFS transporter [Actinomadura madurae]MCP9984974.1 MFS transporter [Actinomadura madurae]MCQ0003467.1 MFS transporter [Actinomadura madurae]MCQ0021173.1 MFS transporter [Actinomadura madurae]